MKKIILMAILAAFASTSFAQLLTGKSAAIAKEERRTTWVARLGIAIDDFYGKDATYMGSKVGYDFNIGFNKPIGSRGAYWGMDFGFMTRGYAATSTWNITTTSGKSYSTILTAKHTHHALAYSPFNFGWKIPVGSVVALDPHIGINMSFDYIGNISFDDKSITSKTDWDKNVNRFDLAMQFGFGIWLWNRLNFDMRYRVGMFPMDSDWESKAYSQKFVFSVGVGF